MEITHIILSPLRDSAISSGKDFTLAPGRTVHPFPFALCGMRPFRGSASLLIRTTSLPTHVAML
ncbi:hypothetical protein T492DRAFT_973938 [Pavlovales sp. CCMP2436]|nr:hypothetical protein T492DRAFT_973938 [Pavlovales sp. CCMP2436]